MPYGAKNGTVNGTDFVSFGRGEDALLLIPGLGDGFFSRLGRLGGFLRFRDRLRLLLGTLGFFAHLWFLLRG